MGTPSKPVIRVRRESRRSNMGQIQVIFGPMFSGKSTELIRRLQRFKIARYNVLIVKYANDNRYTDEAAIATHDKQMLKAVNATRLEDLKNKFNIFDEYDVIGIDEGQFFPDVVEFSEAMANLGKTVIVAALDGTYQRKGFSNILELVPLAEHVIKLTAVCMICFEDGSFTKRMTEDKEVEVIGGAEKYMATCRRCFMAGVNVPASPRPLPNDKENDIDLSNGLKRKSESDNLVESNGNCDKITNDSPSKKALFN